MNADNVREFLIELGEVEKDFSEEAIFRVVRAFALMAVQSVIRLTPVDTGRLKGNWQVSAGEPPNDSLLRTDSSPEGASDSSPTLIEFFEVMTKWKPGMMIWLHNGVAYAVYQEDGTEKMPGRFMAKRTVDLLKQWEWAD